MGGVGAKEMVTAEDKQDTKEEEDQVKNQGFVVKRRCTDLLCLIFYLAHFGVFAVVSIMGFTSGSPAKLINPRDYQGAYCGVEKQWNVGPNLGAQPKQSYMMNVSTTVDMAAKQLICSSAARDFLLSDQGFPTRAQKDEYLCECCLKPCARCAGSNYYGGDIRGALTPQNFAIVAAKMHDLTSPFDALGLFSSSGPNGDLFNLIWQSATKYFHHVCLPSCSVDYKALNDTGTREYMYSIPPDNRLQPAWTRVSQAFGSANGSDFMSGFKFKALPSAVCPYSPEMCVPWPGVQFQELAGSYCTFTMNAEVVNVVGNAAASVFEAAGGDAFVESIGESIGSYIGDLERTMDTFVIVCVASFIIGLIYLVVLRFTVRFCVWFAIFVIFAAFGVGGLFVFVRSGQCKGVGFFPSVAQTGVAAFTLTAHSLTNAVSGTVAPSEACTGNCGDYRGAQTRSRSGFLCQAWDVFEPHNHSTTYSSAIYPNHGLESAPGTKNNFCRNPYNADENYTATTIWCFTTNLEKPWELCTPIGILQPECPHGHVVPGENSRQALKICSYVIWGLAGVWLIVVVCVQARIRLAIALNEVAAKFLSNTPSVLVIPVSQVVMGCIWLVVWALCATFLLSEVPADYTPTRAFATWEEAYGTLTTPGACTDKWPTGTVYRTANDDCDFSDPMDVKCYRCAPPRFVLDWRFAVAFFSLLWNNAFLIAFGQCVIAGAVGIWFFTPNDKKGSLMCGESVRRSNWNVWRYHTGSLAFGSFIIALVQFIRYLMKYFEKQAAAQKNRIMALVLRVLQCVIYCFERFLKFLNKNAYIQIAIRGTPFCTSAKKAFSVILSNIVRFGTVAILGYVIHVIGYVFIMAATLVVGYFLLDIMHPEVTPTVPMLSFAMVSYVVGRLYMNVFGLAVDTCLQCVIFAEEKCPEGSFVPRALRGVLDKSKSGDGDKA